MRALSIRQPWAELILRGVKTVEYRSRPTRVVGERFYLYASKGPGLGVRGSGGTWSRDLGDAGPGPPAWMWALAERLILDDDDGQALPRGLIVGSAVIDRVTPGDGDHSYQWHLTAVERLECPRKPTRHPQPVWFRPF